MEVRIRKLQKQLTSKNLEESIKLRKERTKAFHELDEVEKIKYKIRSKTHSAIQNVELGMTPWEVRKVAGIPRSKASFSDDARYNYGNVWVVFESGVCSCIVKAEYYKDVRDRDFYQVCYPRALIK